MVSNPAFLDEIYQLIPRQTGELLENSYFVDGGDPPTGWSKANSAVLNSSDGFKSPRSLRLNPVAAQGEWWSSLVNVTVGAVLLVVGRVKGTGSANAKLQVRYWTGAPAFISSEEIVVNGTYSDWTEIRRFSIVPATTVSADVRFVVDANDTIDINLDAVSLRQVGGV